MLYRADLHIHSPYSRATSKMSHLHGLAAWAAVKGIDVVGTGDFTHPGWLAHLLDNLEEAEPGFFRLRETGPERFRDALPAGLEPDVSRIRFVLSSEISSIYKRGGKVRKVHNVLFAPDLDSVRRINAALSGIGNLESDGRPILGLDSRDLLEILLEKAPEGFLVPAHIWTPWFSLFGSKSGFDSIEECFGDLTSHVFALETGLSSDPDMNRMISALDGYSLVSNSDCHSPAKLGREANIFTTGFDYYSMRDALRSPADRDGGRRFAATIEFYPEEGKYHCDGHRKCGVCMEPAETRDHGGICPECGRPLTVGVLHRVMELADRTSPVYPDGSPAVHSLVPLPELLGELLQVGSASKKVMDAYIRLVRQFGSEFAILLDTDIDEVEKGGAPLLAEAVNRVRTGKVIRRPGYDGEFGVISVFTEAEKKSFGGQMSLFVQADGTAPKRRKARKTKADSPVREKKQDRTKKEESGKLNPEQQKIVESEARHILVTAGPGTGKTHTLVRRLVRLASSGTGPCTVITFTNKAAGELLDRLRVALGKDHGVFVATLHGYCLKWLRLKQPDLKVAGPELRDRFLRSLSAHRDAGDSKRKGEEITQFLQAAPDLRGNMPPQLEPYFALLRKEGVVDIDAVVPELTAILSDRGRDAKAVRAGTGTLFVDEFQDLNGSQYEVVRLLAETSPVFAIGDPDQAIYGFRGSSPAWFYRFAEDLNPQQYVLHTNYRSAGAVVAAANSLVGHNYAPGHRSPNRPFDPAGGKIFLFQAATPRAEGEAIVRQIERLVGGTSHREIDRIGKGGDEKNISLGDIAVLYRTTRQADILASVLSGHGLPVQVVDVRPYYLDDPVRVLYLLVILASGLGDSTHLLDLMVKDKALTEKWLRELEQNLPLGEKDVLAWLSGHLDRLGGPVREKAEELMERCGLLQKGAVDDSVSEALGVLAVRCGMEADDPDLVRFLRLAGNFGSSLGDFAHHLLLHRDSVVYDERAEAVALMTLHASKGLEFRVVFLAGMEEGILPLRTRKGLTAEEEERHIEEERRLCYVGMTRAREVLYLSHVRRRKVGAGEMEPEYSRFLDEMECELIAPPEGKARKKFGRKKARQLNLFE